jgi:Leucine-rich repeat (LRR) protein
MHLPLDPHGLSDFVSHNPRALTMWGLLNEPKRQGLDTSPFSCFFSLYFQVRFHWKIHQTDKELTQHHRAKSRLLCFLVQASFLYQIQLTATVLTAVPSFSQAIENIDTLTNLESLFLGKNKITKLQNLDALTNLTVLSMQVLILPSFQPLAPQ